MIEETSAHIAEKAGKITKSIHIDLIRQGRGAYLNTSGSSMYPFIKGCDKIKIVSIKEDNIKIGDMIAVDFLDENKAWFFIHRVIDIFIVNGKKAYVTKGDANRDGVDKPVGFERIIGKLSQIERNGLKINFQNWIWDKYLNKRIAILSAGHWRLLRLLAPYISLVLEWRQCFLKAKRRLKKLDDPISNAEELLLICSRSGLNESLIKEAKELLRRGVDWESFMEGAMKSGLAFVNYNSLNKINLPTLIPKGFSNELKLGYLYTTMRITTQYNETKNILKHFYAKGITAVPLKGPILSRRLYGDIAARGISIDIDILIEKQNKKLAQNALEGEGYNAISSIDISEKLGQRIFKKADNTLVDLHWDVNPVVTSDERAAGFLGGTRLRKEDDISYYELKEEELLLQLSVHFVDSVNLMQLRYICDVNELLTKYKDMLDWDDIIEKAKKWRLANSLYVTLILAERLFGSYVPKAVMAELKPGILKNNFIKAFASRDIVLRKNSPKRRFMGCFLKYIFFSLLEAKTPKDYFMIFLPYLKRSL